jgi:flagellar biosynthetic protein FliR
MLPVFGNRSVPPPAKIGLGVFVSIMLFSMIQGVAGDLPDETFSFILIVAKEIVVGLSLGFLTKFVVAGIQMAGEIVGVQMGFGVARVVDPGFQSQISIVAEFQVFLMLLFYLALDGHHFLLRGLFQSYQSIPISKTLMNGNVGNHVVNIAAGMFRSAVKIGAPVIATLLLTNMALGLIARTVPQMNVFIIGLPLRLIVGFLGLILTVTLFLHIFQNIWNQFERDFIGFVRIF